LKDIKRDELGAPKIVDRRTFQAELDALRVREKAHTREGDAIAAARRRLPMSAHHVDRHVGKEIDDAASDRLARGIAEGVP
jgi:predicted dithiol-disulfide oxidoreductase (DUF899 family)